MSFSHWELCQFSFHYSTGGLDPHYQNKLYFYRHVQTEEAFQGIRLNFTWPPVFLGNTVFPQLHPPSPPFFFFFFAYGTSFSLNIISPLILHIVIPKLYGLTQFVFTEAAIFQSIETLSPPTSSWFLSEPAKRYMSETSLSDYQQDLPGKYVSGVVQ